MAGPCRRHGSARASSCARVEVAFLLRGPLAALCAPLKSYARDYARSILRPKPCGITTRESSYARAERFRALGLETEGFRAGLNVSRPGARG
jgi:hypothetical protein